MLRSKEGGGRNDDMVRSLLDSTVGDAGFMDFFIEGDLRIDPYVCYGMGRYKKSGPREEAGKFFRGQG